MTTLTGLPALLDSCVSEGVLTADQATQILARSRATERPGPATAGKALAAEALGYLGGVVVVVSTILIANLYWSGLSTAGRLTVVAAAAAALLGGGLAVPRRLGDVGVRLRSVLWLTGTVAAAGFLALLGADALDLSGADTAVLTTTGTAAVGAVLWWAHRHLVQQVVTVVALMAAASATIANTVTSDAVPGLGAWLVALSWFVLGWTGLLGPRRAVLDLAAAAAIVATLMTLPTDWGFVLSLGTVATVIGLAVLLTDLVLLAVGAVGTLIVLPAAAGEWFPDSAAVPFVLLGGGLFLVAIAIVTARRRSGT